jgi:hypothetical protein
VEREEDRQPGGTIGEGSRRVATLGHGGERRGSAAERGRLSCGDFFRRIETTYYG